MTTLTCPCGSTWFEEGFIDDVAQGKVRWVAGEINVGLFGHAQRSGREHRFIRALCCTECGMLMMSAARDS